MNKDFKIEYGDDYEVTVLYKDKKVFEWSDSAATDYPEDLTWSRMIGGIFFEGVKLGETMAKESAPSIRNDTFYDQIYYVRDLVDSHKIETSPGEVTVPVSGKYVLDRRGEARQVSLLAGDELKDVRILFKVKQ